MLRAAGSLGVSGWALGSFLMEEAGRASTKVERLLSSSSSFTGFSVSVAVAAVEGAVSLR